MKGKPPAETEMPAELRDHLDGRIREYKAIASAVLQDRAGTPEDTLRVQALNEGEWGNRLSVDVADGTKNPASEFILVVKEDGAAVETWDDLSMDPEAENYVEAVINDRSAYVQVTDLDSATPAPEDRPSVQADTPLTGGADGASDITDADYVGNAADRTGLRAFDTVDEVNNLCVPGISSQTVVQAALDYCDGRGDCGYIADCPEGGDPVSTKTFRESFDSSRGYYYFPRIKALDPLTKRVKGLYRKSKSQLAGAGTHGAFRERYSAGSETSQGPRWHAAVLDLRRNHRNPANHVAAGRCNHANHATHGITHRTWPSRS